MVKNVSKQNLFLIPSVQFFSQQIYLIIMGVHIGSSSIITRIYLLHKIVSSALVLLLQSIIRSSCVVDGRLIICVNTIWTITRYSYHPEIVPDSSWTLKTLLRSHKLRSKYAALHTCLSIGELIYQGTV